MIGFRKQRQSDGLSDMELTKELKRIPTKQLGIMTFKRLDEHIRSCNATSENILKILRPIGIIVGMMALEKLNEMFHIVNHLPSFAGG